MQHLEAHPAAELFPLLGDAEFESFKADIAQRGLIEPIWLCEGKILDGRNRYRACSELGVEIQSRDYTGESPVAFVWSLNGTRRQLSKSQLAIIAVKMLAPLKEEAQRRMTAGVNQYSSPAPEPVQGSQGEAVKQAAALVGVGKTVVQDAKAVMEQAPDLVKDIEAGRMSVDKARNLMRNRPQPDAAKQPREQRVADIKRLAAEGHRSEQIATTLGITAEYVRLMAREADIPLTDAQIGRTPKINVSRVIEETVNGLSGYALGLQTINGAVKTIDPDAAREWVASITESLKPINLLRKQLLEIANG